MFFELETIRGFKSTSPVIEILDSRGCPFYYMANPEKKVITFNLLQGNYYVNCEMDALKKPLIYEPAPLPKPEKNKYIHEVEIFIEKNPNKASIDIAKGIIIIDDEYMNSNEIPFVNFMLFHEIGHYKYKTEYKCDMFAAFNMLKLGFNPSQCFYANSICLSDKQEERKQILFNYLKKTKVYD